MDKELTKEEIRKYQKTCEDLAIDAGRILVKYQSKAKILKSKSDILDIVTEADHASESYLITKLRKYFPNHSILSEESGLIRKKSPYRFVIDPLDGTKEYKKGMFLYSINLSLEDKDKILVGTVNLPVPNSQFSAGYKIGAFLNGKTIQVSNTYEIKHSLIIAHTPRSNLPKKEFNRYWKKLINLASQAYRFRTWSYDALCLCWVAQGAVDGYYLCYPYPKWWDIAAGILMVKEAGGKITTVNGEDVTESNYHQGFVATNGKIHDRLLKIVNS